MPLPPSIPTSFVPHPAAAAVRRRTDLTGAFAFFAYGALSLVVLITIGVFIYSRILVTVQASDDAALQKAVASIDPSTVESFVHLRDRLSSGETLLNNHPAFTNFFTDLVAIMPISVRLSDLHLSVKDTGTITLEASGVAKSFNALAATSNAFAKDGRIKDAIFSGIKVESNAVSFTLAATIAPALVAFAPTALPVTSVGTTTASTTTP